MKKLILTLISILFLTSAYAGMSDEILQKNVIVLSINLSLIQKVRLINWSNQGYTKEKGGKKW